ncbi:MAG: hypothetical protein ACXV5R_06830 [Candidatus Angelobacter sp.]
MKIEREIIVDLLPAYFSGESSSATRALVEGYFRENPDFEKFARSAGGALESLKVPPPRLDPEKEKLALERARMVTETRSSFFWLAVLNTLILFLFRIQNGKIVWILWSGNKTAGPLFAAMAVFFWAFFLYARRRKSPVPAHTRFLWMATLYTLLLFMFRIENHKVVWFFFSHDNTAGFIFSFFAAAMWGIYFIQRWKSRQMDK